MLVEWKAPSGKPSPDGSQGPKGFDVTIILWCHYYRQSKIGRGDDVSTVPTESPTVIDAEAPILCKSFKWSDNIFTLMTIVIHIFQPLPHITPHALMQDSHYRDYCESLTIVKSMDETGAGLTHRESYQQQVAPYLSTLNW